MVILSILGIILFAMIIIPLHISMRKWFRGKDSVDNKSVFLGVCYRISKEYNWGPIQLAVVRTICIITSIIFFPFPILGYLVIWFFNRNKEESEENKGE